jgi:UDP-glucose 4-epimerase
MRILITGGAGFIGSHLADAYLAEGHEVAVVDNLCSGKLENMQVSKLHFFHVDITDRLNLREAFEAFKPDVVSHHAAQMSVKVSTDRPVYDAENNVIGLLNVLELAAEFSVKKVIFASSGGTVYGDALLVPTPENAELQPMSPYGITKMVGEHYLRYFKAMHGLDYTVFRYGNVYGPRQDPHGEAGVVAIFAKRLIAGQAPVIHWDGEQKKDYVHVKDVARANVLALQGGSGRAYNIGAGVATSVNELYASLETQLNTGIKPTYGPKREGDVRLSYLEIERVKAELGWTPQIELEQGMVDTVEFFRDQVAAEHRAMVA